MTPRPPKHPEHKKSEYLQLRMTKAERACMQAGAKVAGQPLSKFIRTAAMEKATLLTAKPPARKRKAAPVEDADES